MYTKQIVLSLGSGLILALLASPCSAQIIYVRDAAGYVVPVVIPQTTTFGMGMTVQPVVSPDTMFVRLNLGQIGVSIMDPSTTVPLLVPGPNLGVFDGGARQPAFISQRPLVLAAQGGQQGFFGQANFAGVQGAQFQANQFQANQFMLMSMQRAMSMQRHHPAASGRFR
jgi:hypothetical protein